ncbi:MAG: hypothetical protein J6T94_12110 [Bacteroidaceae bacterium]|nr:hypothetical protein [Bacteroidaceae bacterium]
MAETVAFVSLLLFFPVRRTLFKKETLSLLSHPLSPRDVAAAKLHEEDGKKVRAGNRRQGVQAKAREKNKKQ